MYNIIKKMKQNIHFNNLKDILFLEKFDYSNNIINDFKTYISLDKALILTNLKSDSPVKLIDYQHINKYIVTTVSILQNKSFFFDIKCFQISIWFIDGKPHGFIFFVDNCHNMFE